MIYPAEENDIRKYSGNEKVMISESPQDYEQFVKYPSFVLFLPRKALYSVCSAPRSTVDHKYPGRKSRGRQGNWER